MLKYSLRLLGPDARGARIGAGTLRAVLDVLTEGARGALRLRAEGRSAARGTVPEWLASDVRPQFPVTMKLMREVSSKSSAKGGVSVGVVCRTAAAGASSE